MCIRKLRCSFYRKAEDRVSKLVAGPRVYICDECVAVVTRMMQETSPPYRPASRSMLERLKDDWRQRLRKSLWHEAMAISIP